MKTVAIISQKGGAGKTTLSTHLAVAAQTEGDTVLFDADSQATACQWAEWREAAGKKRTGCHRLRLARPAEQEAAAGRGNGRAVRLPRHAAPCRHHGA
jgi:chromosome partitioning protein